MLNQNLLLTGDDGYNLTNSLRFRSSASAFLNRTPASTTNRQIWTLSAWVKQGSALNSIFSTNASDNSSYNYFGFDSNAFRLYQWNGSGYDFQLITTAVYRDPAAWYHFVIQVDTTQATAANRVRLYVNGVQVTAFSTNTTPSQNLNTYVNNSSYSHLLCRNPAGSSTYFDGYLDEVNFIDGQALTPTSFGSFNALTGVWQPARYTGTYGTNGFYLPFTDNSALTTSSNVGLGRDYSGNGNYWTTNNISITAGTTYDSMTDVPTLTSATQANYAVLNPLKTNSSTCTLSDGNLKATFPSGAAGGIAMSTIGVSSGKWYWELTVGGTDGATQPKSGVIPASTFTETASSIDVASYGYVYGRDGDKTVLGTKSAYGASFTTNDIIGYALDMDAGTLVCYKNNTSQGTLASGISGSMAAALTAYNGYSQTINFGQRPFAYTPPTGFKALNTFNLPEPSIKAGNKYMDVTTYTGNGSAGRVITMSNMTNVGLAWLKLRSGADDHRIANTVTGGNRHLKSNATDVEATGTNVIQSFSSNTFTIGSDSSINGNGSTYVGWVWANDGTSGSTNTAGSITSTVSANPTAGFSVVTYTGTGSAGTIGHGLGVKPSMIFFKVRSNGTYGWYVYNSVINATNHLVLNTTAASSSSSFLFNDTEPTSSVMTVGTSAGTNQSGQTYVAYCWAEIAGFSKFGNYVGNGSTDGTFVYTGFRPAFVLTKRTDSSGNWYLWDNKRIISANGDAGLLYPDLALAESDYNASGIDLLSNGFKLRNTDSSDNASGGTYIYMAFAENPFKNSLAR